MNPAMILAGVAWKAGFVTERRGEQSKGTAGGAKHGWQRLGVERITSCGEAGMERRVGASLGEAQQGRRGGAWPRLEGRGAHGYRKARQAWSGMVQHGDATSGVTRQVSRGTQGRHIVQQGAEPQAGKRAARGVTDKRGTARLGSDWQGVSRLTKTNNYD